MSRLRLSLEPPPYNKLLYNKDRNIVLVKYSVNYKIAESLIIEQIRLESESYQISVDTRADMRKV